MWKIAACVNQPFCAGIVYNNTNIRSSLTANGIVRSADKERARIATRNLTNPHVAVAQMVNDDSMMCVDSKEEKEKQCC